MHAQLGGEGVDGQAALDDLLRLVEATQLDQEVARLAGGVEVVRIGLEAREGPRQDRRLLAAVIRNPVAVVIVLQPLGHAGRWGPATGLHAVVADLLLLAQHEAERDEEEDDAAGPHRPLERGMPVEEAQRARGRPARRTPADGDAAASGGRSIATLVARAKGGGGFELQAAQLGRRRSSSEC